jgi:hypothetical protein
LLTIKVDVILIEGNYIMGGKSVGFFCLVVVLIGSTTNLIDASHKKEPVKKEVGICTCPENGGNKFGRFCGREGGLDCIPSAVYLCNHGKVEYERICNETFYKCGKVHDFVSCYVK